VEVRFHAEHLGVQQLTTMGLAEGLTLPFDGAAATVRDDSLAAVARPYGQVDIVVRAQLASQPVWLEGEPAVCDGKSLASRKRDGYRHFHIRAALAYGCVRRCGHERRDDCESENTQCHDSHPLSRTSWH